MSPRIKMLSVIAILGLGLGLALFFPRRSDVGNPDDTADALPLRDALTNDPATPAAANVESDAAPHRPRRPLRPAWAATRPSADRRPGDNTSIASSAGSAAPPPRGVSPLANVDPWPSRSARQPPVRTHTIVDGDTLVGVAQRYFGRMDRATEIYQLNRDRLQLESPDLLPIGGVLQLPPQAEVPAVRASPPTSQAALRLVPIPEGTFSRPASGDN